MKKAVGGVLIGCFLACHLSGCSSEDVSDEVNSAYEYFKGQDGTAVYPEGMCEDGKEIWGDGSDTSENDIFTLIENKIWGGGGDG